MQKVVTQFSLLVEVFSTEVLLIGTYEILEWDSGAFCCTV